MPRLCTTTDLANSDDFYSNHCIDGQCSNCGECCSDLLPLSDAEIKVLKRYAKRHGLKEHKQAPIIAQNTVDMTCPFRNQATQRCDVYDVRPEICRAFICTKELQTAKHDRDLLHKVRKPHSVRYEVFGNDENLKKLSAVTVEIFKAINGRAI